MDLEEDVVRLKFSRQLFGRRAGGSREIAGGAPERFVRLGNRHLELN